MSRAEAMDAALIGGPNHGKRVPGGCARSAACSSARPERQRASNSAGGSAAPSSAPASTKVSTAAAAFSTTEPKPSGSVTASTDCRSVQARWAIWCAIVHPGAGVGAAQAPSPSGATRASRPSLSSRRSSSTGVGSDKGPPE